MKVNKTYFQLFLNKNKLIFQDKSLEFIFNNDSGDIDL